MFFGILSICIGLFALLGWPAVAIAVGCVLVAIGASTVAGE